ncbi:MAG: hypothetical protein NZ954_09030 [Thermofilaceae archaeon]|nr:hypothetical protein [Thermofilaceae archaeon]
MHPKEVYEELGYNDPLSILSQLLWDHRKRYNELVSELSILSQLLLV